MLKTFFIIDRGTYCYRVMVFCLKNIEQPIKSWSIGSLGKRLKKGWKSMWTTCSSKEKKRKERLSHSPSRILWPTLKVQHETQPRKLYFQSDVGQILMLLGHQTRNRSQSDQIKVITKMKSLRTIKKIHSLRGRTVKFHRTNKCKETKLNEYLPNPPAIQTNGHGGFVFVLSSVELHSASLIRKDSRE